jgi:predicted GNAT family acetyltransferase
VTRKPIDVRYAHAGDLTTKQVLALTWAEGCDGNRFQEIAIVGEQVIGSWQYEVEWHRGKVTIDSSHTGVATRFQRRGIAKALWMHGVARWKPTQIKAMIGTDDGRGFLASMRALFAYASPSTWLHVQLRNEDERHVWDSLCEHESRDFLRKLGEQRIAIEAKKPKKLAAPAAALRAVNS